MQTSSSFHPHVLIIRLWHEAQLQCGQYQGMKSFKKKKKTELCIKTESCVVCTSIFYNKAGYCVCWLNRQSFIFKCIVIYMQTSQQCFPMIIWSHKHVTLHLWLYLRWKLTICLPLFDWSGWWASNVIDVSPNTTVLMSLCGLDETWQVKALTSSPNRTCVEKS